MSDFNSLAMVDVLIRENLNERPVLVIDLPESPGPPLGPGEY